MYDKFMIVEDQFKNVEKDGKVVGFQVGIRLPYYRGVVLSLVGETIITVDGEEYTPGQMTLTMGDKSYPMTELAKESVDKWEFGDVGMVTVAKEGGLSAGEHKIDLSQHMKISYVPGGFKGADTKTLRI